MDLEATDEAPRQALKMACDIVGSQRELATLLGVVPSALCQWCLGYRGIPAERCPQIERLTHGAVRCEDLRPDVEWSVLRGQQHLLPNLSSDEPGADASRPRRRKADMYKTTLFRDLALERALALRSMALGEDRQALDSSTSAVLADAQVLLEFLVADGDTAAIASTPRMRALEHALTQANTEYLASGQAQALSVHSVVLTAQQMLGFIDPRRGATPSSEGLRAGAEGR